MQAICGYVRLDDAPADPAAVAVLNANLCPNAEFAVQPFAFSGDAAALGYVCWGGRSPGPAEVFFHDAESACRVIADARLDQRQALASVLGLAGVPGAAELILRAWLKWGEACAEHLRGDFAFAIWDERKRRLYLARDGMGQRPLHVYHRPGKLAVFATRALALVAWPEVPATLDEGRIADALVVGRQTVHTVTSSLD